MRAIVLATTLLSVSACGQSDPVQSPSETYLTALQSLCNGEAYSGQLVSNDAVDADFAAANIIMGPAICQADTVRIPLAVGEDRSRTWVISKTETGLRLKHDHRHKDGTEDALTQYGGDSLTTGTAIRHEYPVDAETKALFTRENIEVSNQNTWAVEIQPATQFAYEMSRPERFFRIEFDLTSPVPAPPLPWGVEPIE